MRSAATRTPSYRLHKPTGQAVVTLGGKDLYLGKHGTPESREKYDQLIVEWITRGRPGRIADKTGQVPTDLTVSEMHPEGEILATPVERSDGVGRPVWPAHRHVPGV